MSSEFIGHETEGIKLLLGEPKKAIINIAVPTIIGMFIQISYNFVDAVWVAGKGSEALSAIGFYFPFLLLMWAVSYGIGNGGAAILSQQIGAKNRKQASRVVEHMVLLPVIVGIIITIPAVVFMEPIFKMMGAGDSLPQAVEYGRTMFFGTIIILFSTAGNSILRSIGEAGKAAKLMILSPIINIVLSPLFIYRFEVANIKIGLDMGVTGAALATVISILVICCIQVYWLLIKKQTYFAYDFKNFKFDKDIMKSILNIGLPVFFSQLSMSIMMAILTIFVSRINGDSGIAIFTAGWRVILIAIIPVMAIATAGIPIFGAAYGAKAKDKLKVAYYFSIKMSLIIEVCVALVLFFAAPLIAHIFTYSKETAQFAPEITQFLRSISIYFPTAIVGFMTVALFQGADKGLNSFVATFLRTILFIVPLAYLFGVVLEMGLLGINIGTIGGSVIDTLVAFLWGRSFINSQNKVIVGNLDSKALS